MCLENKNNNEFYFLFSENHFRRRPSISANLLFEMKCVDKSNAI
jgi:hypothetical protein